ncbi:MAG TPA: hypothetical protein VH661_10335 [Candidatus Dormibacteraeota bacterium]|jgi:hypothetical protein|nr:hypothetical protein [Candidatus Dormibacteraeota bacterium]
MPEERSGSGSKRRADRALVAVYHEAKLADLLEHVRAGLARYDAGLITAFDLDEIIHHYTRAARELWKFCAVTGGHVAMTAATLMQMEQDGEERDWWAVVRPRRS